MEKTNNEAFVESNRGKRLEYELLRNEILATDRTCVIVLGFLLTVTATLVSIASELNNLLVAWMISPFWIFGYLYLSNKRFVIIKIAYYLRTKIEDHSIGLGWEIWLNGTMNKTEDKTKDNFPQWDLYALERIAPLIMISANPFFVAYLNKWEFGNLSFWSLWIFEILLLVKIIMDRKAYNSQREKTADEGKDILKRVSKHVRET